MRNTSASSMQSPPASADATGDVIILSLVLRPPRGIAQVEALPDEFGQADGAAPGYATPEGADRHWLTQAAVVDSVILDHGHGVVCVCSIYWVLRFSITIRQFFCLHKLIEAIPEEAQDADSLLDGRCRRCDARPDLHLLRGFEA